MAFGTKMMGTIYVTDSIDFINTVPDGTVKIISLDEDNSIDPNSPNVVLGTCLLPPVEALIAEVDGNEDLYDVQYVTYLNSPEVQRFITAIIGVLHMGNSLLLYAPQLYENISIKKLRQFMWDLYGIGIGIINDPNCICCYDERCIPIWLNMLYHDDIIDAVEFLYEYPEGVSINIRNMNKLIIELKPFGKTYQERLDEIERFRKRISCRENIVMPLYDTRSYDALLR